MRAEVKMGAAEGKFPILQVEEITEERIETELGDPGEYGGEVNLFFILINI